MDRLASLEFPRLWQFIGWLMVVVVVALTLIPDPPQADFIPAGDKIQHLLAYAVLMFWFRQAFTGRARWVAFLIMLGVMLEFIQGWAGYRYLEYADMLANTLGVLGGLLVAGTPLGLLVVRLDGVLNNFAKERNPS